MAKKKTKKKAKRKTIKNIAAKRLLSVMTRRELAAFICSLKGQQIPIYQEDWNILFPDSPDDVDFIGQVEPISRQLKLNSKAGDNALTQAFFHELCHAMNWSLTEEHVEGLTREMPNVFLWLLNKFLNFVETYNGD